jgi:multiple sugar transport system substrate-binding protein
MRPDFEKLTGIQVAMQVVPEQQVRQKLPIELNAKSPGIDVYASSMHVEKRLFAKAGWYEPLNKYLENPKLTPSDYNWKDFGASGTWWTTWDDGTILATPGSLGLFSLMYRKDLYAEKGLKVPTTLDELQAAVKATHRAPGVYGFVGRGLKNANVPLWGMFLQAMGGTYLDPTGARLATTSPEAIESARMYAGIMKDYAPPGAIGFNWNEAQGSFSQGLAACWPDGLNFAAPGGCHGQGHGKVDTPSSRARPSSGPSPAPPSMPWPSTPSARIKRPVGSSSPGPAAGPCSCGCPSRAR